MNTSTTTKYNNVTYYPLTDLHMVSATLTIETNSMSLSCYVYPISELLHPNFTDFC